MRKTVSKSPTRSPIHNVTASSDQTVLRYVYSIQDELRKC